MAGRVQKLLGKGERSGSPHETGQDTRRKFFFKFLGRTKKRKKIKNKTRLMKLL